MDDLESEWRRKGATLSDKTAREEFGLTQAEIVRAIRAGKLHYREGSMYGNPWLRLLRREVEALVGNSHGEQYLKTRQAKRAFEKSASWLIEKASEASLGKPADAEHKLRHRPDRCSLGIGGTATARCQNRRAARSEEHQV